MTTAASMTYVYIDRKPSGEVFYAGVGSLSRVKEKTRNSWHSKVCVKYPTWTRTIVEQGTRENCLEFEQFLISEVGRRDLGKGTLVNLTDGGEWGVLGYKFSEEFKLNHPSKTNEARKAASLKSKEQFSVIGSKDHLLGVANPIHSPDAKIKHSIAIKKAVAEGRHNSVVNPPMRIEKNKQAMLRSHKARKDAGTHHLLIANPAKDITFKQERARRWKTNENPMRNPEVIARRVNPSHIPEIAKSRGLLLKGRVCVNNGERYIRIYPELLEQYLSEGWEKGRI